MLKNEKKRIRATFNIDRKLYELLKLSSQIERNPMSRIIDQLLVNHVTQYESVWKLITENKLKREIL